MSSERVVLAEHHDPIHWCNRPVAACIEFSWVLIGLIESQLTWVDLWFRFVIFNSCPEFHITFFLFNFVKIFLGCQNVWQVWKRRIAAALIREAQILGSLWLLVFLNIRRLVWVCRERFPVGTYVTFTLVCCDKFTQLFVFWLAQFFLGVLLIFQCHFSR